MNFLFESKRDDYLNQYLEILRKRGIETTLGQLKGYLLNKFASGFGMHSLSKPGTYYLNGVTRYYFEGLLTTNKRLNALYPNVEDKPKTEVCTRLDALIDIFRNSHIDSVGTQFEQPEDFGNLPLDKLLKKYNKKINQYLGIDEKPQKEEVPQVDQNTDAGKNYTYEILYSYDDAKKFEQYTRPGAWCITYGQQHYNAYIKRLGIHYVVFMRKGFEDVPRQVGEGFTKRKPHDAYGNSLICVLQSNKSSEPIYITSRWNHGYGETSGTEADHAYTKEEFLKVIGCDESVLQRCFEQWKEGLKKNKQDSSSVNSKNREEKKEMLRKFKYAQMMMNNGAQMKDFFEDGYVLAGKPEKPMKSILLVSAKSEDGSYYYTICDRGQLKFDQYFVKSDTSSYYDRPRTVNVNNTILAITSNDKTIFYSIKKRTLLDADGVKQFTHADYHLKDRSLRDTPVFKRYYMVAARGNQIAVLDTQIGDFMTAPNGSKIFESIVTIQTGNRRWSHYDKNVDYRGHIHLFDIDDSGFLKMVYDSSAQEVYIYSVQDNKFINVPGIIKVDDEYNWVLANRSSCPPNGYIEYNLEGTYRYSVEGIKFLNIATGEEFNILGYTIFSQFDNINNMVYAFWPKDIERRENDKYHDYELLYDVETKDLIKLNGKPVEGDVQTYSDFGGYILISPNRNSYMYVYNPYTKQFVFGDELVGHTSVYPSSLRRQYNNGLFVYKELENGERKYIELPPAKDAIELAKENIKEKFNLILEKIYKSKL